MYYKKEKRKKCPICGIYFKTLNVQMRYCSFSCSKKAIEEKRKTYRKKCEQRNIEKFNINKESLPIIGFLCKVCRKKFYRYRSQVKKRGVGYCSVKCREIGMSNKVPTDDQLMELWSKAVKKIDNNKCSYCGKTTYLNSHHIFSRSNGSTRYDLNNGITLCAGHHTLSSTFSAHKTPVEFIEWLKDKRGSVWYDNLRITAKQVQFKRTADELREIRTALQRKIQMI